MLTAEQQDRLLAAKAVSLPQRSRKTGHILHHAAISGLVVENNSQGFGLSTERSAASQVPQPELNVQQQISGVKRLSLAAPGPCGPPKVCKLNVAQTPASKYEARIAKLGGDSVPVVSSGFVHRKIKLS